SDAKVHGTHSHLLTYARRLIRAECRRKPCVERYSSASGNCSSSIVTTRQLPRVINRLPLFFGTHMNTSLVLVVFLGVAMAGQTAQELIDAADSHEKAGRF